MYEERIAEKVMEAYRDQNLAGLMNWLKILGCKVESQKEGEAYRFEGIAGVNGGMTLTDPVNMAVMVGFAIAGQFWPQAFPKLLKFINNEWKALAKGKKDKTENKKRKKVLLEVRKRFKALIPLKRGGL